MVLIWGMKRRELYPTASNFHRKTKQRVITTRILVV